AAVPVFIEFMQEALKGLPPLEFKAPPGTKFAQIGPNREAFRPGTEPRPKPVPTGNPAPFGDQPFPVTPLSTPPLGPLAAPPPRRTAPPSRRTR
ncbi:MAG: penicillin-binding protein 1A, partial [Pseudomonadota bacterium]|nr:penicillin-binding protein 1A [Pseudomonadota bacterium]